MRVSRHDDDFLVFVRRPGILAVALAIANFTMLALAIRALRGGDTGTGVLLLVLSGVFAAGMIAMTAFQELRFDRAEGIVERHTRSFFGAQRRSVALSAVETVSVDRGDGRRGRRYYRPVLLLHDPPGGKFALSKTFSPFPEALRMTRLIDSWLGQTRAQGRRARLEHHAVRWIPADGKNDASNDDLERRA
ncbi:MAG: hypothetical protein ACXIVD_07570 [Salinarimonas sp.]